MDPRNGRDDLGQAVISILVPVLGRPHQIEPLLDSIAAATHSDYRVVFICSPNDETRKVCRETDADTIVVPWEPGRADFAKKINLGFRETESEWLFQAATDLKFHDGWDVRALRIGEASRIGVVGTNDLGNPTVKRGTHATHILFSREYIDTHGGTYDNTGAVFCELYDHQWVDTEFIQTATLRQQFKPSLRSIVEHMHPHWNKGEHDETYAKSERSFREDSKLYNSRIRAARILYRQNQRPTSRRR